MSATVCTCIRHATNLRHVAVPDPDCPACTRRQQQGNTPTFVIYDETAHADRDAARTATGLGRLLILLTGLALIALGIGTAFTVAPMSGGHLIASPALIVLGALAAWTALKEQTP